MCLASLRANPPATAEMTVHLVDNASTDGTPELVRDAFPEVELHAMRGLRKGPEAARIWATRKPGGVQQEIELEQLY